MSPSPASKRRRLNASSSTKLSQPFKSPFKTPLKQTSTDPAAHTSSDPRPLPLDPATPTAPSTPVYPTTAAATTSFPESGHPVCARPAATPRGRGIPATPSPQLARVQKRHTALLGTLASARASLETHAQALKLEASSTDLELERLVAMWKGVSREAAEEVFAVVAARVESMGGVKRWRQQEREKREGLWGGRGGWGWEEERVGSKGEDEGGGDERDDGNYEEAEERERIHPLEEEDSSEETFTMGMMLRSLNVDLQLIGYDPESQKWID